MELQKFCEFFYASHYIPIAVYKNRSLCQTCPAAETVVNFHTALAPYITLSGKNPEIFSPSDLGLYGSVKIRNSGETLLIGPVFHSPVTENAVLTVTRLLSNATEDFNDLSAFLSSIPNYSYTQFVNLIAYLHYCLNEEVFDVMADLDAVKLLQYNMAIDFTERVAEYKVPKNTSREIFRCMQFIRNHTSSSIGIDEVAAYTGKSRSHITKRFREETGISIGDYITQCKIRDAKRLLRYTDQSLVEISNYLCFSSQPYFQTVFKKETGMTPNEYRKKMVFQVSDHDSLSVDLRKMI